MFTQTSGYSGPVFKSFTTYHEAQIFMQANSSSADASFAAASIASIAQQQNHETDQGQPYPSFTKLKAQTAVTPPKKVSVRIPHDCNSSFMDLIEGLFSSSALLIF